MKVYKRSFKKKKKNNALKRNNNTEIVHFFDTVDDIFLNQKIFIPRKQSHSFRNRPSLSREIINAENTFDLNNSAKHRTIRYLY